MQEEVIYLFQFYGVLFLENTMATRRARKSKRSRKRGGKTSEQNFRNCTKYWKEYTNEQCKTMSDGGVDFPGWMNKNLFRKTIRHNPFKEVPHAFSDTLPKHGVRIVAYINGKRYTGTVVSVSPNLVLGHVYDFQTNVLDETKGFEVRPQDTWKYLADFPPLFQDEVARYYSTYDVAI